MDRTELLEAFAGFPARLAVAIDTVAGVPVASGEWGPAENVRHLIAVEGEIWQARLALVAVEDGPRWTWVEPGLEPGFEGASVDEIVAAFGEVRAETVATIRALDDAGWARSGTHATYGVLDVAGLLRVAVDHDRDHIQGIVRAG